MNKPNNEKQITIVGNLPAPTIGISPAAEEAKRYALESAAAVAEIATVEDLDAASGALTRITSILTNIEKCRKEVKQPVIDVGRGIDDVAKKYCAELETEKRRLSVLVGTYNEAQRLKAERAREEAAQREREAMATMRERETAALDRGDIAGAEEARNEAAQEIASAQIAAANAEGAKAEGISTRKTWKWEVTDIKALFAARPECVTLEPNGAVIRALIKNDQTIPGLRIWSETAAIARSSGATNLQDYDY